METSKDLVDSTSSKIDSSHLEMHSKVLTAYFPGESILTDFIEKNIFEGVSMQKPSVRNHRIQARSQELEQKMIVSKVKRMKIEH